jgi:hypothetical protein
MSRKIIFAALKAWPGLDPLVGERIFEASNVDKHVTKPLIVLRMHTEFPVARMGGRGYMQLWAHDKPGSYLKIDDILAESRKAIESIPPQNTFLEAKWIETGVDLRDDAMGTVVRYSRFQITHAMRELIA